MAVTYLTKRSAVFIYVFQTVAQSERRSPGLQNSIHGTVSAPQGSGSGECRNSFKLPYGQDAQHGSAGIARRRATAS
jgi:hypothetical protein